MAQRKRRMTAAFKCMLAIVVVAGMIALGGCGSTTQEQAAADSGAQPAAHVATTTITDMVGREVVIPSKVDRVIGLGASSLRIITYLGAIDKVVGVENLEHEQRVDFAYNYAFQDIFKELPVIGEGGSRGTTPNEEALVNVNPQVILANMDRDAAETLQERTGIPVVVVTLSDLIFDQVFYDNVALVGEILEKSTRAKAIIAYMQDIEKDLKVRTSSLSGDDIATAYAAGISFRGGHGFAGTEANFPPFKAANVENIADNVGTDGAFDIDLEMVASAQPQIIFIESSSFSLVKESYSTNPSFFASLDAVINGSVYSLIGYRFYAANVELALANCYQVGANAYPEQFSDVDPAEKLDEITEFFLGKKLYADLEAAGYSFEKLDISNL